MVVQAGWVDRGHGSGLADLGFALKGEALPEPSRLRNGKERASLEHSPDWHTVLRGFEIHVQVHTIVSTKKVHVKGI